MPFSIRERCGHCRQIGDHVFTFVDQYNATVLPTTLDRAKQRGEAWAIRSTSEEAFQNETVVAYATMICPGCGKPSLAVFETKRRSLPNVIAAIDGPPLMGGSTVIEVKAVWPAAPTYDDHAAWPQRVRDLLGTGQRIAEHTDMLPSVTISICRSALDVATKELGATKGSLAARIDELRDRGTITAALADWAHHVRLEGNEAIHEIEGTRAEADELMAFVKLFIQITFTLPAEIADKRR